MVTIYKMEDMLYVDSVNSNLGNTDEQKNGGRREHLGEEGSVGVEDLGGHPRGRNRHYRSEAS